MKKKINTFFQSVFANKRTKIMFCFAVMSFILLITVTFSWFISIIDLPNSTIKTGNLSFVAKGYDEDGNFISTIINDQEITPEDPDMVKVNSPLFVIDNWSSNLATTSYISVENSGSLDLEFVLTFTVNGSLEDLENLGGFWYRIERLDNSKLDYSLGTYADGTKLDIGYVPKKAYYDNVIKDYISKNGKVVLCSDACKTDDGKYNHICTEFDRFSRNLITIDHLAEYATLDLNQDKICIYRIDVGFRKEAIEERYTNVSFDINGKIYASQPGSLLNPDGLGATFTVTDEVSLNNALENALPGDTIVLGNKINYNGDLIINKCIGINTYGNDLVVNGNFIYNYASSHTLKINLASGGNIQVLSKGGAGGNFEINAPNSEVSITGNNYTTNIYVEKNAVFNATNAVSTRGLFLSGANILNKDGDPKDIDLASNTRLTLDYGGTLSFVEATINSTNIEIVNFGTIETINLAKMLLIDAYPGHDEVDTEYPQILIDNYNKIVNAIQLPDWSTPFNDIKNSDGLKEGNTKVIREWGALEMSVLESLCDFKTNHITDLNIKEVCVVPEIEDRNDSLIIYYGEREGQETTVKILLREYFEDYHNSTGSVVNESIASVRKVIVYSIDDKIITADDLSYFNSMTNLAELDLFKTTIQDNTIPKNTFKDKATLKKITLPDTLKKIEEGAFANTGLRDITIPESVTSWNYTALTGITYVYFNSLTPSVPTDLANYRKNLYLSQYLLVDEAVIDDYRAKYGDTNTDVYTPYGSVGGNIRIFVKGDITDDGQHVVRQTTSGYELICYTGSNDNIQSGYNLYLNGKELNVTSIGAYCYSNVKTPFNISFNESITHIGDRAFFYSNVRNIDFNNVRYIGKYAFYNCLNLTYIDTKRVEEIDEYGFASCMNLFEANFPELLILRKYAFSKSRYIAQVSFYKLQLLENNVFYHKQQNINDYFNHMVRTYFYNDSFQGVSYAAFSTTSHVAYKCFVKPELVDEFRGTGCVGSTLVYPMGDIVGEYLFERTFTISGDSVTCSINLGEYVICGPKENATFVCYNKPLIDFDYTVPSIATFIDEDGNTISKEIKTVGSYAFNKVKFEYIKFSFGDSITTVDKYLFNGHSNTNGLTETTYYNRITEIDFNNVESLGDYSCLGMLYLSSIDAPNLKVINQQAFKYCIRLYTANLPKVEEIYDQAFYICRKLFYIDLPSIKVLQGSYLFGDCLDLVSIKLGPNLEKMDCSEMITGSMTLIREFYIESNFLITKKFIYAHYKNNNFKIYVPKDTISSQFVDYSHWYREFGYKVGTYEVTNSDGNLVFNLGEYVVTDVELYDKVGVSISTYNVLGTDIPSDYTLPATLDGKPVLRVGYRSYMYFDYGLVDTSNFEHGENFAFHENLLVIGSHAFYETMIRVSEFKNVKYIDTNAFYKCKNMYIVEAPELLFIGKQGFRQCTSLYRINAPKLYEVESLAIYETTSLVQLITNIQVAADSYWLGMGTLHFVTFATDKGSLLSGTAYPTSNPITYKLTNSEMASKYPNASDMTMSIEDIILTEEIVYDVIDANGEIIYNFITYRYAVNAVGDEVKILKCLTTYKLDENYVIPGVLDDRIVTSIATYCYRGRTELMNFNISFANSITKIENYAFYAIGLTGTLDLNNVTTIGAQAFQQVKIDTLIARKVTSIGSSNFIDNPNLVAIYMDSLPSWTNNIFTRCPNLKYIYTEQRFILNNATDLVKSGVTFVINCEIEEQSLVPTAYWNNFNNITMYVPYKSLDFYKEAFKNTSTYKNFNILPIGVIVEKDNEQNPTTKDLFILLEVDGEYDYTTGTYEKVYELLSIITQNSDIIIPSEYESYEDNTLTLKITKINKDALKGQSSIINITLPEYLKTYHDETFSNAIALQNIYVNINNPYYTDENGVLYSKDYNELICYPKAHSDIEYSINLATKIVRSYAFKDCLILQSVILNSNLQIIGIDAFKGTNLTSIKFTSENPPIIAGMGIFDSDNVNLEVYVPASYITNYKSNNAFVYLQLIGYTD